MNIALECKNPPSASHGERAWSILFELQNLFHLDHFLSGQAQLCGISASEGSEGVWVCSHTAGQGKVPH